jgi:hypothetical protein
MQMPGRLLDMQIHVPGAVDFAAPQASERAGGDRLSRLACLRCRMDLELRAGRSAGRCF